MIRKITFSTPGSSARAMGRVKLLGYWDGERSASIDAPVKFLTGAGAGIYYMGGKSLVSSFFSKVTQVDKRFEFTSLFPMPFTYGGWLDLKNDSGVDIPDLSWEILYETNTFPPTWYGTFHANYVTPETVPGADFTFLDYKGTGKIVGTVVNFERVGDTLEGDPHFFLDDSETPQVLATGTEEWGLGGNYWRNGGQVSLPFGGHPSSMTNPDGEERDGSVLYRFLLADAVTFNRRAILRWEHGSANQTLNKYRASVLWYGNKQETAKLSDELIISNGEHRTRHGYVVDAGFPSDLEAAYGYIMNAPTYKVLVATVTGNVRFTMALDPANIGAFLRRTFDYGKSNQRAEVWVDGQRAGVWYNAGSSNTTDSRGVKRRLRDDEFLIPEALTSGKSSVQIEIRPQLGGTPNSDAWTEIRYNMYSFVAIQPMKTTPVFLPDVENQRRY